MRKLLIISIVLFCCNLLYAQEEMDTTVLVKIREEAYQHSQVMQHAFYITDFTGPRLTWSSGYDSAAKWALGQFKKWGLQNVHKEEWEPKGKGWDMLKCYVAIKAPYYQNIAATPKAWSGSTNGLVSGNVVVVKAKDSAEFVSLHKGKLKGKVILFDLDLHTPALNFNPNSERFTEDSLSKLAASTDPGEDILFSSDTAATRKRLDKILTAISTNFLSNKMWTFLKNEGALATLTPGYGRDGTYRADGTYNFLPKFKVVFPEISIRLDDYLRLLRLIQNKVPVKVEVDVKTRIKPIPQKGYNLVAEIPGTDPQLKNELVIIGGHFDSWHGATGATDNGAGSIVMIEVMRILKTLQLPLKRTVRIVLWGGEEQGLLGSLAYVDKNVANFSTMKAQRDYELVSAYYNLDNGSGRIRGIYLQDHEELRSLFQQWLAPFKDLDATTVTIKNSGFTDNEPFELVGIPAFQFIQDPLNYETRTHHTNADSYDELSEPDLKQAATIIASIVSFTANRPGKLTRKPKPQPYGDFKFLLF